MEGVANNPFDIDEEVKGIGLIAVHQCVNFEEFGIQIDLVTSGFGDVVGGITFALHEELRLMPRFIAWFG